MIVTVHWILTFLIIAFLIASGLKPKNFFLINLMLFIMVLRCYLPFFDFEERRERIDYVFNSTVLLKSTVGSLLLNISTIILYENSVIKFLLRIYPSKILIITHFFLGMGLGRKDLKLMKIWIKN